jgi:hypothetical protein
MLSPSEHLFRGIELLDASDDPHLALTAQTLQTSTPKTRKSSAAQSRRYVDGTDVDFGDAAGDDKGGDKGGDKGADGGVVGSIGVVVVVGRGTTCVRRRSHSLNTRLLEALVQQRDDALAAERDRARIEEFDVISARRLFVDGLALLRMATQLGLKTQSKYRGCRFRAVQRA